MMNFRRLALVSGLAALSAVAGSPKAQAIPVTQDVLFNGTFPSVCTFTGTTDGNLLQTAATNEWIEASNGTTIGTVGIAGTTTLNCSAGGQLTVAAPVAVTIPSGFTPTVLQSVVYNQNNNEITSAGPAFNATWTQPTTALNIPINTDQTLQVGMIAGTNANVNGVPNGTYQYRVTLTATPN